MTYQFKLEKYKGGLTRHRCPKCGHKGEFVRYVDLNGNYVSENVGRCNRESKCRYHYTPRQFFENNPGHDFRVIKKERENLKSFIPTEISFVDKDVVIKTVCGQKSNNFALYLKSKFNEKVVESVLRRYLVGTWKDGRTVFW